MMHTVVLPGDASEYAKHNSIRSLLLTNPHSYAVAGNDPNANPFWAPLPTNLWVGKASAITAADGNALCNAVTSLLNSGRFLVVIDELSAATATKVQVMAEIIRDHTPYWMRWGIYLIRAGSLAVWQPYQSAIDAVFRATGHVFWEAYPRYSTYCNQGSTTGARDIWLGDYFQTRHSYLVGRRDAVLAGLGRPIPNVKPVFGVTDKAAGGDAAEMRLMDCSNAAIFLDRMFYVWRTRTSYAVQLHQSTGGAGSYKWQHENISTNGRDEAYRESWEHYCRDDRYDSLKGQPGCTGCV